MARGRRSRREAFSDDEPEEVEDLETIDPAGSTAATAVSHPPKAPRYSNVAFQSSGFDKSTIVQPLNQMKEVLLTLLQRLKSNKEEMNLSILQTWKERIIELSKKIIFIQLQYQHMDMITNNYLNTYLEKEGQKLATITENSSSSSSSSSSASTQFKLPNIPNMIQQINQQIDQEMKKIHIIDDEYWKKIQQIVKKIITNPQEKQQQREEEEEEEFEILENEEEISETTFNCPYTMKRITQPMKNCNPNKTLTCIHIVSKEGVEAMLKNRAVAPCPVGGCSGKWSKNHIEVDDAFLRKIKKFERQQTLRSQVLGSFASQSRSTHNVTSLNDDDD